MTWSGLILQTLIWTTPSHNFYYLHMALQWCRSLHLCTQPREDNPSMSKLSCTGTKRTGYCYRLTICYCKSVIKQPVGLPVSYQSTNRTYLRISYSTPESKQWSWMLYSRQSSNLHILALTHTPLSMGLISKNMDELARWVAIFLQSMSYRFSVSGMIGEVYRFLLGIYERHELTSKWSKFLANYRTCTCTSCRGRLAVQARPQEDARLQDGYSPVVINTPFRLIPSTWLDPKSMKASDLNLGKLTIGGLVVLS